MKMHHSTGYTRRATAVAAVVSAAALSALAGCGIGTLAPPTPLTGAAIQGSVFGGQQPVVGASVQLYAAKLTGYGLSSTPLITTPPQTGINGGFSVTGSYTCPVPDAPVYLVATGGDAGGGTNPNLALMVALGSCNAIAANAANVHVTMNEITTVASAYALSPFMSNLTSLSTGSSASAQAGLLNAFADVNTLSNTAMGSTPGVNLPAGTTVPSATITSLADILAACVNSTGGVSTVTTTPCGALFNAANPGGTAGTAPTDTVTAALNIAHHPSAQVSTLFNIITPTPAFSGGLTAQPNDFTLAVNYAPTTINKPSALATDGSGNVWITNSTGNSVTVLSHTGVPSTITGSTAALNAPSGIAIDAAGNAWISNKGNNTVSQINGTSGVAGTPISGGGLNAPTGVAIDSLSNVWVSNSNASVTKITGSTPTNYTPAGVTSGIAIGVTPH